MKARKMNVSVCHYTQKYDEGFHRKVFEVKREKEQSEAFLFELLLNKLDLIVEKETEECTVLTMKVAKRETKKRKDLPN